MFARFEIMPTFASAITKTVLLSLETNVAKVPTDAGSKSDFEKSFRKSSRKIWWFKIFHLSLHHFPLRKKRFGIFQTVL